jgi:hypothetical protein
MLALWLINGALICAIKDHAAKAPVKFAALITLARRRNVSIYKVFRLGVSENIPEANIGTKSALAVEPIFCKSIRKYAYWNTANAFR